MPKVLLIVKTHSWKFAVRCVMNKMVVSVEKKKSFLFKKPLDF